MQLQYKGGEPLLANDKGGKWKMLATSMINLTTAALLQLSFNTFGVIMSSRKIEDLKMSNDEFQLTNFEV